MIRTFGDAATARFFQTDKNKFSGMDAELADVRYALLDETTKVDHLYAIGRLRLHKLSGNLSEFWSIDINGPWRLIFKFDSGDAYDVTIYDPHR